MVNFKRNNGTSAAMFLYKIKNQKSIYDITPLTLTLCRATMTLTVMTSDPAT